MPPPITLDSTVPVSRLVTLSSLLVNNLMSNFNDAKVKQRAEYKSLKYNRNFHSYSSTTNKISFRTCSSQICIPCGLDGNVFLIQIDSLVSFV
jgi:hypothetical protein